MLNQKSSSPGAGPCPVTHGMDKPIPNSQLAVENAFIHVLPRPFRCRSNDRLEVKTALYAALYIAHDVALYVALDVAIYIAHDVAHYVARAKTKWCTLMSPY